eukprot:7945232-Ditylum_brightwellii.AAC.2
MWKEIEIKGKKTQLGEYLVHYINPYGIMQVEMTNKTDNYGKWFVLYKADFIQKAKNFINATLPTIINKLISPEHKLADIPVQQELRDQDTTIRTYAAILQGVVKLPNPQDETPSDFNAIPATAMQKRRAIALDNSNFPAMDAPAKDQNSAVPKDTKKTIDDLEAIHKKDLEALKAESKKDIENLKKETKKGINKLKENIEIDMTSFSTKVTEQFKNINRQFAQMNQQFMQAQQYQSQQIITQPSQATNQAGPDGSPGNQPIFSAEQSKRATDSALNQ